MRLLVSDYVQVRYTNIYSATALKDLKILAIGDVHISDMVSFRKINLLKERILNEKPDYIVFTGDLIDRVEELDDEGSVCKLKDLLLCAGKVAKTFVIFGNHDYIDRISHKSYLNKVKPFLENVPGIILLDNDIYYDDNIGFMGYTETIEYYSEKEYDYEAFYDDFIKHDKLYKNLNKKVPLVALAHSPEFSDNLKVRSLFDDYDLIICGHTHDGCVPFGFGDFKWGIINPKKKFFPKNIRGVRKLDGNYILITGGITKISKCAPKLLHPLNVFCPVQMDVITLSNSKFKMNKKWY